MNKPFHDHEDHYAVMTVRRGDELKLNVYVEDPRVSDEKIAAVPAVLSVVVDGEATAIPLSVMRGQSGSQKQWEAKYDFSVRMRAAAGDLEKGLKEAFNLRAGKDYVLETFPLRDRNQDIFNASVYMRLSSARARRAGSGKIQDYVEKKLAAVKPALPAQVCVISRPVGINYD